MVKYQPHKLGDCEFNSHSRDVPIKDPQKRREYQRRYQAAHYKKKSEYYKTKAKEKQSLLKTISKELREENPCIDCGQFYPHYVMDFDHLPGSEKLMDPARLYKTGSISKFLQEIDKCEIVCANCHRIRTHNRLE